MKNELCILISMEKAVKIVLTQKTGIQLQKFLFYVCKNMKDVIHYNLTEQRKIITVDVYFQHLDYVNKYYIYIVFFVKQKMCESSA